MERATWDVVDELDASDRGNVRVVDVEGFRRVGGEDVMSPLGRPGEGTEREEWRHIEKEEERGSSKIMHSLQR